MQLRVLRELRLSHGANIPWTSTRIGQYRKSILSRVDRYCVRMATASGEAKPDPVVQYVVIRGDLAEIGWPLGAIIAQACHASVAAIEESKSHEDTKSYLAELGRMHKVVLQLEGKGQEEKLRGIAEKLSTAGADYHLWVEQPENFPTCLASAPRRKSDLQKHFKGLKLAK